MGCIKAGRELRTLGEATTVPSIWVINHEKGKIIEP
jgi:hypothetical protein